MFAVTGITGNVGGEVARNLLAAGQPVRGVVRETRKGETWAKQGCELAEADINDAASFYRGVSGSRRCLRAGSTELRSVARLPGGTGRSRRAHEQGLQTFRHRRVRKHGISQ